MFRGLNPVPEFRQVRIKVAIGDEGATRRNAQKHYEMGFVRFVLTRAAAFGSALFILNLLLMLRSGGITALKMETAALICAGGGILLGIGRWMYLLRVIRRNRYS
jgi:hypothetical protein